MSNAIFIRLLVVLSFSFVKRFFSLSPYFYEIIKYAPLLVLIGMPVTRRGVVLALYVAIVAIALSPESFPVIVSILLILCSYQSWNKIDFYETMKSIYPFYVISCVYGLWQWVFGYSWFELNWIESGLALSSPEALLSIDTIRPFSFFAGMPEFALIVVAYSYYHYKIQKYFHLFFDVLLLFIISSRGMIVATLVALLFEIFFKKSWIKLRYFGFVFVFNLAVYMILVWILPFFSDLGGGSSGYLLISGTFNARLITVMTYITTVDFWGFLFGYNVRVWDNLYLYAISNYGLIPVFLFMMFFRGEMFTKRQVFFFAIAIGYSFYSDSLLSFYFFYYFVFLVFSGDNRGYDFPRPH